jgi:hypothetical protein
MDFVIFMKLKVVDFKQVLFATILLIGCGDKSVDSVSIDPFSDEAVDFSMIKENILKPHCLSCHSTYRDESQIGNFIVAGYPEQSKFYQEVVSGRMPQGGNPLGVDLVDMLRRYIENKPVVSKEDPKEDLEVDEPDASEPQEPRASYAYLSQALFQKSCTSCHFSSSVGRVALDEYTLVRDYAEDALFQIELEMMPPTTSSVTRVSPEILELFREWIQTGFPRE